MIGSQSPTVFLAGFTGRRNEQRKNDENKRADEDVAGGLRHHRKGEREVAQGR